MVELIDKKLVLKEIASFAIGGDPQEEPMANVDHIGMSIEDFPTVTEAEIRANAIEEFLQFVYDNANREEFDNKDGWALSDLIILSEEFKNGGVADD